MGRSAAAARGRATAPRRGTRPRLPPRERRWARTGTGRGRGRRKSSGPCEDVRAAPPGAITLGVPKCVEVDHGHDGGRGRERAPASALHARGEGPAPGRGHEDEDRSPPPARSPVGSASRGRRPAAPRRASGLRPTRAGHHRERGTSVRPEQPRRGREQEQARRRRALRPQSLLARATAQARPRTGGVGQRRRAGSVRPSGAAACVQALRGPSTPEVIAEARSARSQ